MFFPMKIWLRVSSEFEEESAVIGVRAQEALGLVVVERDLREVEEDGQSIPLPL